MLDWLKTILGDTYTEDIDKKVSEEIGKSFVSRADFNTANEAKKTLEATVKDRDGQLEKLKASKPEELQAQIDTLTTANKTAAEKYESDLKAAKLDFALETSLTKAGAVNSKAVKALLDQTKISLDGENLIGLDDQLTKLKETEKWAFTQVPDVPGSGGNPAIPPAADPLAPVRAAMGLTTDKK